MKFNPLYLLLLIVLFFNSLAEAQVDTLVKYYPGFRFNDGIYLSQDDFLANCPTYTKKELFYMSGEHVAEIGMEYPIYTQMNDTMYIIDSDSVWGYSKRGQIFLRNQDYYNRLVIIGNLCHIMHTDEVVDYDYSYTDYYYDNNLPVRREMAVQYLLNLKTGEKEALDLDTFTRMLEEDPKLYTEFTEIPQKGKRKNRIFLFLRRFNDRHPMYFPINGCDREVRMGDLKK